MWSVLPDLLNSARFIGYNDVTVYGFLTILIIATLSGIILKVNFISAFFIPLCVFR